MRKNNNNNTKKPTKKIDGHVDRQQNPEPTD